MIEPVAPRPRKLVESVGRRTPHRECPRLRFGRGIPINQPSHTRIEAQRRPVVCSGDRTIVPKQTHRRSAAERFAGSKGQRTPERCTRQRQADGSSGGRPKAHKPVADAGGEKILRRY